MSERPNAPSPQHDAGLVEACRNSQPGAWEALVRRFEKLVYTVARRGGLNSEESADVFQAVFMRLHKRIETLEQPERIRAWLVTTARRETLRLLGERRRNPARGGTADRADEYSGSEIEPVDPDPLPDQVLEELQLRHRVRVSLELLDEPCGTLLTLLYCGDTAVPYAEVAVRLGVPIGSIGPTRARCLAKLRKMMESAR